jgi:hypothetical protein
VPPRARKATAEPLGFEDVLRKAADKLRGSMDSSEYKHVVLGLIFLKYVEDAFEERRDALRGELAADAISGDEAKELLEAAEVIAELVELAEQMRAEHDRGTRLGLRDDELAFYDAVCQNDSAVLELGDETLKKSAHELVAIVRRNTTVDWDKKEQVRASLRRYIKRLLVTYHYPPDQQESAVLLVLQQAEVLAGEVAA